MKYKNSKNQKYNKKNYRKSGTLGGEVAELGYGSLEAAKESIEDDMYIWNQEELDMAREQILKRKTKKK